MLGTVAIPTGASAATGVSTISSAKSNLSVHSRLRPVRPVKSNLLRTTARRADPVVIAGTQAVYEITVRNNGPSDAVGVVVSDTLNSFLTFVSSDPTGCTANQQVVTCNAGTVPVGTNKTFRITVRIAANTPKDTVIGNLSSVTSTTNEGNPADNTSPIVNATVDTRADLVATKTAPAELLQGTHAVYTLGIQNSGPSDAQNTRITDVLDPNLTFVSSNPVGCTATGQTVTCPTGILRPTDSRSVQITVNVKPTTPLGTVIMNTASVASDTTDPNSANNTTVDTTGLPVGAPRADLSITKTGPTSP
ncbi:DUF11 domain-containing protein [Sinosporangium siamense]|uniref:DUF11 domain-containing protein n=1 Tax=Sinosporangium siamense TaxID=1367973 RepID=UPI0035E9027A